MAKSIQDYQKDYQKAKTQKERDAAHAGAESIRAKSGYSGGADGSQKISLSKPKDKAVNVSSGNKNSKGSTTKTITADSPDLTEAERSIFYGAQDWAKDGKQYAYKDAYGFEHVGDLAQAMAYGGGNASEYTGASKGGYARDASGNRARIGLSGSVEYGNAPRDKYGNVLSYKASGQLGDAIDLATAQKNYGINSGSIGYWQDAFKNAKTEAERVRANQEANRIRAAQGAELQYYQPQYAGGSSDESVYSNNYAGGSSDESVYSNNYTGGTTPMSETDPYAEIKAQQVALLKAQKQARIAALQGQKESAISSLGYEKSTIAPQYLQQRATLKTSGEQAARRAQEALAARGLASSGASAQGDIARNVALQQGMTSIGEAEAGTLANIAQRKTQAEQAYASGVAQAESEAAATAAQAEIQRLMQAQQAQEATAASAAQAQFDQQKMAQEQANKLQIEELRIAAQEASAQGNFARAQELAKYKNDLEAQTIKLRASVSGSSGGGGSSTNTKVPTAYTTGAKAAISNLGSNATLGQKQSIINTYAKQMRAAGLPESTVQTFLIQMGMAGSTLAGAPAETYGGYDYRTLQQLQKLGIE